MAFTPEFEKCARSDILCVVLGVDEAKGTTIDPMAMQIE